MNLSIPKDTDHVTIHTAMWFTRQQPKPKDFLVLTPLAGSYSNIPFFENPAQFIWRHSLVSIPAETFPVERSIAEYLKSKENRTTHWSHSSCRIHASQLGMCTSGVHLFFFFVFTTRNLIPYEQSLFK